MLVKEMNWFDIESYLKTDDRVILSIGSTEQHAYLSLCTDFILSSKLSEEVGHIKKVPVYPGLPFGMAAYFTAYPGTINIQPQTYGLLMNDILDSLYRSGFRRIFIINGHGGNSPVQAFIGNWLNTHTEARVFIHNWWASTKVMQYVKSISSNASHASWMENFPWTRLQTTQMPEEEKPKIDVSKLAQLSATEVKRYVGDGNYGGKYQQDDKDMLAIWDIAIAETCELFDTVWVNA